MILVTGATGTVGSELVRQLQEHGLEHRALVRDPDTARARFGAKTPLFQGSFEDVDSLEAAMDDVSCLFLLSPPHPQQADIERTVVDAADRCGVERIVKISALGARLGSPIKLADAHARTQAHIAEIGLEYTFLQPSFFMQNLLAHIPSIQATGAFYAPNGSGKASMIDARDIAGVAAAILADGTGHADQTYVLTGPKAVSFFDAAAALTAAVGREIQYVPVEPAAAREGMAAQGLPDWLIDDLLALAAVFAAGHAEALTSVVEDVTGEAPRSIEAFASDYAGAFRS